MAMGTASSFMPLNKHCSKHQHRWSPTNRPVPLAWVTGTTLLLVAKHIRNVHSL